MNLRDMDEREFNRFNNLFGQAEKIYGNREHSFRTEANYKQGMQQFCKFLASETKINNIKNFKPRDIFNFVDKMNEQGLSPSTQKNYLAAIRDFADRKGIDPRTIPNNDRLDLGKKISGNVDKAWGDREFKAYKDAAESYDKKHDNGGKMGLMLDMARTFGCRLEGILGLEKKDIDNALNNAELHTKEKNGKINVKPVNKQEEKDLLNKIKDYAEGKDNQKIFVDDNFKVDYKEAQNFMVNNRSNIQDSDRMNSQEARKQFSEDGQVRKGNLTWHGLRHTNCRGRMQELMDEGKTYEEALLAVSKMFGHNRKYITKVYLAEAE